MARRKTTKKTGRRRRISGTGTGSAASNTLLLIGGAVIGRVLQNKLTAVNPKIVAAGEVVAGIMAPKFVKNKMAVALLQGVAIAGGLSLAQQMGVIAAVSGIGADEAPQLEYVAGNDFAMAGDDPLSVLAGDDFAMAGDDPLSVLAGDYEEMGSDEFDY